MNVSHNQLHRRAFLSLFGSALLLSATGLPLALAAPSPEGKKWALLIGIDDYQALNNLHAAANDAHALAKALKEVGGFAPQDTIRLLVSDAEKDTDKPTRNNILNALATLSQQVVVGDTVYVMCFCHGIVDPDTNSAYILPSDATASDEIESSLAVKYFRNKLDALKPRVLLFAFDMCLTEPTRGTNPRPLEKKTFTQARGAETSTVAPNTAPLTGPAARFTTTLFGCSPGQSSWESKADNRGYFSLYLEKGLRGSAADANGNVTLDALRGYVKKQVKEAVKSDHNGAIQEPSWNDAVQGDIEPLVLARVARGTVDGTQSLIAEILVEARTQLEYVEARDRSYPEGLVEIAKAYANAGDPGKTKGVLLDAKQAVAPVADPENSVKYHLYDDIVECQEALHDIGGAKETLILSKRTVGEITDASQRCESLCKIAEWQTKFGDKNGARATIAEAKRIVPQADKKSQVDILESIATVQAHAGDIKEAKQTASEMQDINEKQRAFRWIAEAQLKSADLAGARKTADALTLPYERSLALGSIAAAQFGNGDRDSLQETLALVVHTINSLPNVSERYFAFRTVASTQLYSGNLNAARLLLAQSKQAASHTTDDNEKANALSSIAVLQAKAGDLTGAWETARSIALGASQYSAFGSIAEAQIRARNLKEASATLMQAKQIAGTIINTTNRASAFRWIAMTQYQAGATSESQQTFTQAKQIASTISAMIPKVEVFCAIAEAQVQCKNKEDARETLSDALQIVSAIKDADRPIWNLFQIASLQAKAGFTNEAKQTADMISSKYVRYDAFGVIAEAEAQAGNTSIARAIAKTITSPRQRLTALCKIAQALAKRSNVQPNFDV